MVVSVYDGNDADAVEDILEFANTQLVEYRTYDARLDVELDAIYRCDAKLRSVSEMYHVFADQAAYARSLTLEIVIIVLIAFEAVIGVLALRHCGFMHS